MSENPASYFLKALRSSVVETKRKTMPSFYRACIRNRYTKPVWTCNPHKHLTRVEALECLLNTHKFIFGPMSDTVRRMINDEKAQSVRSMSEVRG